MSKIYYINGFPSGTFTLSFETIDHRQWKHLILTEELRCEELKNDFCGGQKSIKLKTY